MAISIEFRFLGGLTQSQEDIFQAAAERWMSVITDDLPPVEVAGETISGVVIDAQGMLIDGAGTPGEGNILGQAGPTIIRLPSLLPVRGSMQFDTFDLLSLEVQGQLENVIIHEIGHVLGIGTLWEDHELLVRAGTSDPVFIGSRAALEWGKLIGADKPVPVPVANMGGPGSADGHWREGIFMNELMTPQLNDGVNPISRVTIASLADMGYQVELGEADDFPFSAPSMVLCGDGPQSDVIMRCSCNSLQRGPIQPLRVHEK